MAITTTADLNSLFNTIYERAIFVAREMNLMVNLVSNYSDNTFHTRNFTIRPQVGAESIAEGVDYASPTTFGKSSIGTLTPGEVINQVILTDIEVMNDPDNSVADASQEMGQAIATKIDTDLISVFSSFSTDVGPGAGASATISDVAAGVSILRNRHAGSEINVVLHPYAWHDIFVLLGQPATQQALLGDVANAALRDFYLGSWLSCKWYVSANIAIDGSADGVSAIFSPQAIAFDSRIAPRMETERDASLRAWEMNMVAGYAYGLGKRPTYGLKYTCDLTEPT